MSDENYPDDVERDTPDDLYESTGTPKLAGIFFGVVVLCAIFFVIGYKMGKGTVAATAAAPVSTAPSSAPKPSAAHVGGSDEMAEGPAAANPPVPVKAASAAGKAPSRPAPEMAHAAPGNFAVQVAAVSRQEDAEALEAALRSKSYPVFIVSNQPGDKLYHVQVGPFSSLADAETMKSRLAADGYTPIVKK